MKKINTIVVNKKSSQHEETECRSAKITSTFKVSESKWNEVTKKVVNENIGAWKILAQK